jgi:hypothetical protein
VVKVKVHAARAVLTDGAASGGSDLTGRRRFACGPSLLVFGEARKLNHSKCAAQPLMVLQGKFPNLGNYHLDIVAPKARWLRGNASLAEKSTITIIRVLKGGC